MQNETSQNERDDLTKHAMYTASDLSYLRAKGYTDEEIRQFWDRDLEAGKAPVHHAPIPDILGALGLRRDGN
jgi:hypothetical protein